MTRQDVKDEVIHLRSAGVDLGKRFLLACVRTPSPDRPGRWTLETERFETTRAEVLRLLAWLTERRVEVVVMEATSDYWRSVYYPLQPHLNVLLVNPAHLKGIRGRKSDPSDAAFLARAGASGMVMGSFVPAREIRELRDLTRRRTELARAAGREAQRLEKELEDTGMKLTSVVSNVVGATGRAILAALINGERDPHRPARQKIPALVKALDGEFTEHHAFMVRHYLDEIDHDHRIITTLDNRIAELLADHDQDLANLDTIPGIGRLAAEIILEGHPDRSGALLLGLSVIDHQRGVRVAQMLHDVVADLVAQLVGVPYRPVQQQPLHPVRGRMPGPLESVQPFFFGSSASRPSLNCANTTRGSGRLNRFPNEPVSLASSSCHSAISSAVTSSIMPGQRRHTDPVTRSPAVVRGEPH